MTRKRKKETRRRKVEPTPLQIKAVDEVMSGKHKHLAPAMRKAGYTQKSSRQPGNILLKRRGVQIYLKRIGKVAKERYNMPLRQKVMETYLDGLEATKLTGKDAVEHPDWPSRKAFADGFAKFFGWVSEPVSPGRYQQFNFFSVDEKKRTAFNKNFKGFLKKFYSG